ARIGLKVGGSEVGVDTWLGARPEHGPDRVLVDPAGHMVGIALKPYELLRITSRVDDFSIGEGGAPRPRVGRVRRAAAGTAEPARGATVQPGAPLVADEARPPEALARRPAVRERRVASDGAPGRLMAQLPGIYHGWPDLSELLSTFETILCEP